MYVHVTVWVNVYHTPSTLSAGPQLAVFAGIVKQLLGDAQQRIVFRAQVQFMSCYRYVVQQNIMHYWLLYTYVHSIGIVLLCT